METIPAPKSPTKVKPSTPADSPTPDRGSSDDATGGRRRKFSFLPEEVTTMFESVLQYLEGGNGDQSKTVRKALGKAAEKINELRMTAQLPPAERTVNTCATKFYALRREFIEHAQANGPDAPFQAGMSVHHDLACCD